MYTELSLNDYDILSKQSGAKRPSDQCNFDLCNWGSHKTGMTERIIGGAVMAKQRKRNIRHLIKLGFRNRIRTSALYFHSGSAFICCDRILYGSECAEQPGDQLDVRRTIDAYRRVLEK